MSRIFCIPGIVFLAIAFTFNLLVSISLPSFRTIDIVRVDVGLSNNFESVDLGNIRLGIWSYCVYGEPNGNNICGPTGLGYSVPLGPAGGEIKSSWTKGLAMHPLAAAFTFVALLLSLSTHLTVTLLASLVSFFAALLTLIAFSIDIALLLLTREAINENFPSGITNFTQTNTEAGFWLTFASLILLLLAGCTVCFGRRQNRMSDARVKGATEQSYPAYENKGNFLGKFREKL